MEKREVKFDLRTKFMLILVVNLFLLLSHSVIFELVLIFGLSAAHYHRRAGKERLSLFDCLFDYARYRPAFDALYKRLFLYFGILYHSSIEKVFALFYSREMDFDENGSQ